MDFRNVSNEDLFEMCLRGDESAWTYVHGYVLAVARSPRWRLAETPEDMAQSIVCHLLSKGIERVDDRSAFRGYIGTVAVNFIRDSFKKKRPHTVTLTYSDDDDKDPIERVPADHPGPEENAMVNSLSKNLWEAVSRMSEKCRDVLTMYIDYKMGKYSGYKAMAQALGKSIGTLSSQIKRCLETLREMQDIKIWLEE